MLESIVAVMEATVQLDQTAGNGARIVGAGFLVASGDSEGASHAILVTAKHVLSGMQGLEARIGFRSLNSDGAWSFTPAQQRIRDDAGAPLWTSHPKYDVAALSVRAPPQSVRAAIPLNYLADEAHAERSIRPGTELLALGYPRGLAANAAGFPILRAGRVASYPTSPSHSPVFLLDFSVFPGNSGGPVFLTSQLETVSDGKPNGPIAGMLLQQVEHDSERLAIGVVIHAKHIRETVELMRRAHQPTDPTPLPAALAEAASPAAHTEQRLNFWQRIVGRAQATLAPFWRQVSRLLQGASKEVAWDGPTEAQSCTIISEV